jgi:hypothetical protein
VAEEEPEEFRHTHWYDPIGWDRFDPRPHPGSGTISPGSPVQRVGAMGPGRGGGKLGFIHVRDQFGNNQSVARGSLKSKNKYSAEMAKEKEGMINPPSRFNHPELNEQAEAIHEQYFHDRRGEGRRDRPM